jgi:hypothetical protein
MIPQIRSLADIRTRATNLAGRYASLTDRAANFMGIFLSFDRSSTRDGAPSPHQKREHSMTRLAVLAVALGAFATPVHAEAMKTVIFNGNVFDAPGQPTLQSPAATTPKAVHHVKKKKSSAS